MKIYTKAGDKGETGLFGGGRVRKDHPRIASYGSVDELNVVIGWVVAAIGAVKSPALAAPFSVLLEKIQNDLFDIGAVLATPDRKKLQDRGGTFVTEGDTQALEAAIDAMEEGLPPLKTFILPGGSELAARCHLARTVCRRAEREIVSLADREPVDAEILAYINRLSDYFFVLARWANKSEGVADKEWKKR